MFFEIIILGIFIATAMFNIAPDNNTVSIGNGLTEIVNTPEDWIAVSKSSQITFYANPGSIRKSGYKAKMWRLNDYKVAQINGEFVYLSKKSQEEYDCDVGQVRLLYTALYDENMGAGGAVYTHAETYAWEPVVLDTDNAVMWKIACGRK